MASFRTNRTFDVFLVASLLGLVWWSAAHRVDIGDWFFFHNYQPPAKVAQVAAGASLTDTGRHLLYRTDPQFAALAAIQAECDIERLGCLSSKGQSYILDDPAKPNQSLVTAVHEMLHLAYRRLPESKKAELAPLLEQAVSTHTPDIEEELRNLTTADDRRDEAHSLLGTEYKNLPPELETYYATYFTDRTNILDAASEN